MDIAATIFLSYAREDADRIEILFHKLSAEGFTPWMDKKNILPGEKWRLSIKKAIRQSDFFLACLSAKSLSKRGLLQKEIQDALDICNEKLETDIYLIPVRLEECKIPENLSEHQWVDLFEKDGFEQLADALRTGVQRRQPEEKSNERDASPAQSKSSETTEQLEVPEREVTPTIKMEFRLDDLQELVGHRIDDYILESILGLGHETVVFLARLKGLQRRVAMRLYGLAPSADLNLDEALTEVRKESYINHPSVLNVNEPGIAELEFQGSTRRVLYVPTQYAPLGNTEQSPPLKDKAIDISDIDALIGLVEGMKAIHEHGVLHRDIKPANILRFEERSGGQDTTRFRITDFGLTKVLYAMRRTDEASAFTPYTAPEQLNGAFSAKGDTYSLGATFFYMLTGVDPFPIQSDRFVWDTQLLTEARPNAMDYNPYCPPRLALLIMQMMSVNPDERPYADMCIDRLLQIKESIARKLSGFPVPKELEKLLHSEEFRIWYVPNFRGIFRPEVHLLFGTRLYAIRFQMAHPVLSEYKRLIEYIAHRFSDCFSMYETYGSYDLHLLVWAEDTRSFKKDISHQFRYRSRDRSLYQLPTYSFSRYSETG